MGSAERYFSSMKAQKFMKIVNIHGSQPIGGCVYVWGSMCGLKYFLDQCLLDALILIMPVKNASWKAVISGFSLPCYSLDQL
jgi:hypothetical protein